MSFQMGEQHLDLFASSSAFVILPYMFQISDSLAGIFVHVPRDSSEWRIGAGLADRTRVTGFLAGEVAFDPVGFLDPPQ